MLRDGVPVVSIVLEVTRSTTTFPLRGVAHGPSRGGPAHLFGRRGAHARVPRVYTLRTVFFAVAFMTLFSGYYFVQSFVSSLYPLSNVGFALLYSCYGLGSLLAPSIGKRIRVKTAILLSAGVYIVYVAAVNSGVQAFYLSTAPFLGFAAGVIWLQQGICMSGYAHKISLELSVINPDIHTGGWGGGEALLSHLKPC